MHRLTHIMRLGGTKITGHSPYSSHGRSIKRFWYLSTCWWQPWPTVCKPLLLRFHSKPLNLSGFISHWSDTCSCSLASAHLIIPGDMPHEICYRYLLLGRNELWSFSPSSNFMNRHRSCIQAQLSLIIIYRTPHIRKLHPPTPIQATPSLQHTLSILQTLN